MQFLSIFVGEYKQKMYVYSFHHLKVDITKLTYVSDTEYKCDRPSSKTDEMRALQIVSNYGTPCKL